MSNSCVSWPYTQNHATQGKSFPQLTDSASGLAHVPDLLVGLALVDTHGKVASEEIGLGGSSKGVFWASISELGFKIWIRALKKYSRQIIEGYTGLSKKR